MGQCSRRVDGLLFLRSFVSFEHRDMLDHRFIINLVVLRIRRLLFRLTFILLLPALLLLLILPSLLLLLLTLRFLILAITLTSLSIKDTPCSNVQLRVLLLVHRRHIPQISKVLEIPRHILTPIDNPQGTTLHRVNTLAYLLPLSFITRHHNLQHKHAFLRLRATPDNVPGIMVFGDFSLQGVDELGEGNLLPGLVGVEEEPRALGEFDSNEQRMLHLMPDIRRSQVIKQPLEIILDLNLTLRPLLVLPLNILLLQVLHQKRFNKTLILLLMFIPRRFPRIHKNRRTNNRRNNLRRISRAIILYKNNQQQIKLHPFMVIRCRGKLHGSKERLPILNLKLRIPPDPHINKMRRLLLLMWFWHRLHRKQLNLNYQY